MEYICIGENLRWWGTFLTMHLQRPHSLRSACFWSLHTEPSVATQSILISTDSLAMVHLRTARKDLEIRGTPDVSWSHTQKVQSLSVYFRHCSWKSHLWPRGWCACLLYLQKEFVLLESSLDDRKPARLWFQRCGKIKLHQRMKAGDLLNIRVNNLGVGRRGGE